MQKIKYLIVVLCILQNVHSIAQIKAKKSGDFINSIGVVVHLDRGAGPYSKGENVRTQLLNIGIRHIRDQIKESEFTNYAMVKDLANHGIKMTGFLQGDFDNSYMTPAWWIQQVKNNNALYAYEAFEGPNESDLGMGFTYKGQVWPGGTKLFQQELYNTVKSDSTISNIPVLGPTIGSGLKSALANVMGNISSYVDYGNFHYYKAWGQSYSEGYPDWDLQSVKNFHDVMFGNKPYMATEGSYSTAIQTESGISEVVNAKYTLRFLLEYWRLDIVRTFKYELFDEGITDTVVEDKFGLIENDGTTLKPAATAIKDIISILTDPSPAKIFMPGSFNFSITNADSYTHYNLLQKSTGKFYLIIWNDAPSWDDDIKSEINNNDSLTITFNQAVLEAKLYAPCTNGTNALRTSINPTSINIAVPNHPYIYEITVPVITKITEQQNVNRFYIYPNPAKTEIFIEGNNSQNTIYQISDMGGEILQSGMLNKSNISIENLKSGIYLFKIKADTGESVQRFAKE